MYTEFGPLNVAFDYYPTNTVIELTINNLTRFVTVNSEHKKGSEAKPILRLSPTAAKYFSVDYKSGFVPCLFKLPEAPGYLSRSIMFFASSLVFSIYLMITFLQF